jgi:predicted nucleic acid-binding protein
MFAQNLNNKQKQQHMTSAPTFLQQYNNEREKFVDHSVIGGEICSSGEAKKQSIVHCIVVRQNTGNLKIFSWHKYIG